MSTERISWTSAAPTTEFILYADRIGQSVSGNYTTVRIIIKAYNRGSTSSYDNSSGYQHGWPDGYSQAVHEATPFLPSGYSTGEQRWSVTKDYNIPHGSNGTRGAINLNMTVSFDGQSTDKNYSFNDFPDIDVTTVPGAPTAKTPTNITSSGMRFDMDANADDGGLSISNAQVRISKDSSFATGVTTYSYFSSGLIKDITGLADYTTYYLEGRTYNSKGWSAWSNRVSAKTLAVQPADPTGTSVDQVTQTSARFNYSTAVDTGNAPITLTQVGWGTDITTAQTTRTADSSTSSTITGLTRYTKYYFFVRFQTAYGWSAWSAPVAAQTLAYVPAPPINPVLDTVTQTSVHYAFSDGADNGGAPVDSRQIGYGTDPNTVQTTISSDGDDVISGLSPAVTYYFWSRTHNVAGWSDWTATRLSAKTVAGARIRVYGVWTSAIPYVRVGGVWKVAQPFINVAGVWKRTG